MGFNLRGGDKSSLALLSSKRGRAYARSRADEAFALPAFSDGMPAPTAPPQRPQENGLARNHQALEHDAENVKQTMLQHESVFKEQLHELHRLYQKQCVLMAESSSGPPPDRVPEPPSSNSSVRCKSEAFRLEEERSIGNASVLKVCDSNHGYQALLGQMDDFKRMENSEFSRKRIGLQLLDDPESTNRKQGRHHGLYLEQSAASRPIIDLEQLADEHFEIEIQEEKPHIPGLSVKAEQVFDFGHSSCFGSSNRAGGTTERPAEVSRGSQCNKLFGVNIVNSLAGAKEETKKNIAEQKVSAVSHANPRDSRDKKLFGFNIINNNQEYSREEMPKDCFEFKDSASNRLLPYSKESALTSTCAEEEPQLYCKGAFSTSGLPDLNGDTYLAEVQVPTPQPFLPNNAKGSKYVDLEVSFRPDASTSKLPHWLCQGHSTGPFSMHNSLQSSVSQPKTLGFVPQVHDNTMKPSHLLPQMHARTSELHKLPMATANTSTMYINDPTCAGSQSSPWIGRREAFLRENINTSSSQFFHGPNVGTVEQSYSGVHVREHVNGHIPYYSSQVRDNEIMSTLPLTSTNFSPNTMGRQGYGFETVGSSMDFLSKGSSEAPTNFATMFNWSQQTESFSSLLQQASNPEPFCKTSSPAKSCSPWGITSSYQDPPSVGIDYQDRAGLRIDAWTNESSSFQPNCATVLPILNPTYAGSGVAGMIQRVKDSQHALCNQLETPSLTGQVPEVSSGDHPSDLDSRKTFFDLNVSSEDCMPKEGHFNDCNTVNISCSVNRPRSPKPESGISRSSGWGPLDVIKAPFTYQPEGECSQKKDCLEDVFCTKGEPVATPSDTNRIHLHLRKDTSYFEKPANNRYLEGDVFRDEVCADYRSGEGETGGFLEAKSSDGSGLTSCESRDGVHLEHVKASNDSNMSSSEACHSLESRIPTYNEDVPFSLSLQQKMLPSQGTGTCNTPVLQDMQPTSSHIDAKTNGSLHCKEFADESEFANAVAKKDLVEPWEVAEILFSLGLNLPPKPPTGGDEDSAGDSRKGLCWLADIIPHEDYFQGDNVKITHAVEVSSEINTQKTLDSFEAITLALKPVDPNLEGIATHPPDRVHGVEIVPTLRRRPSRRGRAGKDFQKEMFRSMNALSRHEVTEDLQIIEGLIKSAVDTTNSSSSSPEKPASSPEQISFRSFGKARSTSNCCDAKPNAMLNMCNWGETTRRKRMGRQRSQWLSLPPGVQMSLFPNDATHVTS